jgi:hypothetical protein
MKGGGVIIVGRPSINVGFVYFFSIQFDHKLVHNY